MIFSPLMARRAACAPRSADMALQRFLLDAMPAAPARRTPGYTVAQDEKATTLQLDVPGLAREQLQITIEGAQVQVKSV
ncbi:MAG: Hsp20/alpha crystallin family protein, partial [Burkholderiaceae bacterium]|nr:Hsp20/alpha crystallin family protein [Burkholderiaceae bacterium]